MKKTKFIIIAAILVAFVMTLNAFAQNGSKAKSNKNARSAKSKGPKTTNFSFGVSNGGGQVGSSGLSAGRTKGKNRKPKNAKVQYNDWHFSKDRRKPRKH
ncbi:MAG: hypothetical protein AAB336_07435 [Acidobacteriota bacterium]